MQTRAGEGRKTLRNGADLAASGVVEAARIAEIDRVAQRYAVAVTPEMIELIDPADPHDPIARQFVPDAAELTTAPEERSDPIGDARLSPVKGIVHRYPDRVLLKPLHTCPVYCRFCFRREAVGPGGEVLSDAELSAALTYVREHQEIWEVILTGGDPLLLSPRRLSEIVAALDAIPHVGVIRLHTRVPVVSSAHVTAELVASLRADKAVYVVLHANHPRELTARAVAACRRIIDSGIPMLAQSVLLKGVNDDPATLEALMRGFVRHRIKPYYLHHGDLAPGTSHLRTSIEDGQHLMRHLRGRVSGLCQPGYVLDIPGGHGKVPIGPTYLGHDQVADWRGKIHAYPGAPAAAVAKPGTAG
ncbi:MAG TPA: lysine-2,3-aminomutase-like protein [Alphaproteobacteria bacterium]|nr:lysine-2,3-aminomutase-like protein [Alphaproteobacteria bacterium]